MISVRDFVVWLSNESNTLIYISLFVLWTTKFVSEIWTTKKTKN